MRSATSTFATRRSTLAKSSMEMVGDASAVEAAELLNADDTDRTDFSDGVAGAEDDAGVASPLLLSSFWSKAPESPYLGVAGLFCASMSAITCASSFGARGKIGASAPSFVPG